MSQPPTLPKYLTLSEAAAIHRVHVRTIKNWIAAGLLTAYRVGPTQVRVIEADVYALATPISADGAA